VKSLPNNFPFLNPNGLAATSSTQAFVSLSGEYFQAQGSNGRSCSTCHMAENAWAINPSTISLLFELTGGTHPIFNALDANNPDNDLSTVEARRANYSMMLTRGVFRRGGAPRADREWDVIAVDDPHGFANANRIVEWRRVMPAINFQLGSANVNWDGGNTVGTDQLAGLVKQANGNVTGAQQGQPATADVIADIANFELSLSTAQSVVVSVGRLNAAGARGGPEALAQMTKTQGRFDLFDAWIDSPVPGRRQIARGQELFNSVNSGGRSCNACHNSANNGTNTSNTLFDTQTASAEARMPDLPLSQPSDRRRAPTHGHRSWQRHGTLERLGPLQDADAARSVCACTLLPQRQCGDARGCCAPLRAVPWLRVHQRRTRRSGGLPEGALEATS
jgi:hypothetical protein